MSRNFAQGHALIVGVGGDLPNTVDDAKGIESILLDATRCAYPKAQVHTLTGRKATRNAVLRALDKLSKVEEDASVIIYFSGHGARIGKSNKSAYYLVTHGYDPDDLDCTAISGKEFAGKLKKLKAKRLLVLLDCCHAGGFSGAEALAKRAKSSGLKLVKAAMPKEAETVFKGREGRVLIASSTGSEESFAGEPYSVFTTALIAAFCGEGAAKEDGYVRVVDLALYTHTAVKELTDNQQHPTMDFEKADNFVVSYYAAGKKIRKGLPESIVSPRVETSPGSSEFHIFDQSGWSNIMGNVSNTHGDQITNYGNTTNIDTENIDFYQPNWTVGSVVQVHSGNRPAGRKDKNRQ